MGTQLNSIESVKEYLIDKGINPSFQRLKIYEYLAKTITHPTVEMIFTELAKEIPTLSKTTIYNTLNLFQNSGIVSGLTIDANEIRYDPETRVHAHFKCFKCGSIFDIPVEPSYADMVIAEEHEVKERHFYLKGTCKNCLKAIET
ncbi:MAG TPA: transcriptional repressor [Spirochaetes bacterium]|nr:transcriptional repressor [Spirochaetota bacterium]